MENNKETRELQLVSFVLANEEYAVEILRVREIIRLVEITSIPNSPDFIKGIINLRDKVIPVIDIKKRFGLLINESDDNDMRIVIMEVASVIIGIIVDSVNEVMRLAESAIEPTPDLLTGIDEKYLKGVGKLRDRLVILLDLDRLLKKEELYKLMRNEAVAVT